MSDTVFWIDAVEWNSFITSNKVILSYTYLYKLIYFDLIMMIGQCKVKIYILLDTNLDN
jgi:hypothetical protein